MYCVGTIDYRTDTTAIYGPFATAEEAHSFANAFIDEHREARVKELLSPADGADTPSSAGVA